MQAARERPIFDTPNILWFFGGFTATAACDAVIGQVHPGSRGIWILLVSLGFLLAFAAVSAPKIVSFTPASAKPGATITIAGLNFTGASSVMVDGMKASFKVVSAKKLSAKIPTKAKKGTVTVVTKGGTAKSSKSLTIS